jgi:DNA transformation protein and related proteins
MSQRALADFLVEHLMPLGHATARAMFGGFGVYLDGVIVAIVADDAAYLKADAVNRGDFEAAGSRPFTYDGASRAVAMSYWEIPAEVLEDPDELRAWAAKARTASVRARATASTGGPRAAKGKTGGRRQPRRMAGSRRARR